MDNKICFTVTIEETVSQSFSVYANDEKEAVRIARQQYDKGKFVLEPGNLVRKRMIIDNQETNAISEWIEF